MLLDPLEPRVLMAYMYYISPLGNDANSGTSTGSAFRSVARVNQLDLNAGDRVLFQGGQTFSGELDFTQQDSGTSAAPVIVGSYGSGRATIHSGAGSALDALNVSSFELHDLNFVGSGRTTNTGCGISFLNDQAGDTKLAGVRVDDVDVSGFGYYGLFVMGQTGKSGFRDLRVTDSAFHDNAHAGVYVGGQFWGGATSYAHQDLYFGHLRAYNNSGVSGTQLNHSGNGIVISDVDGAVIERSVAHDNGWLSNSARGGPIGIWAWDANDVVIQHNESYRNRTAGSYDGGGFDLDGGCTNSVMQYNYSHDNDGAGYLVGDFPGARPTRNNTVRYNVSQNDGRRNSYAGIHVYGAARDTKVHNNTVFQSPSSHGSPRAIYVTGQPSNTHVRNNIFQTTGGARAAEAWGGNGTVFQGNAYWSSGAALSINWAGVNYSSYAAWQNATGQEKHNAGNVGRNVDPKLQSPGGGGTFDNADVLGNLSAYKLRGDSPLIDAGLNLNQFGINPGPRDFYGATLPMGAAYDIGAAENTSAPVGEPAPVPAPVPTGLDTWATLDVGHVGALAGSAGLANGIFTLRGAGADIWGTSDAFRFVNQQLTGDGQIVARVTSVGNTDPWAKAGVMVRASLAANAAHASLFITPGNGVSFQRRGAAGADSTLTPGGAGAAPVWLKLVRSGNTLSAYRSSDGAAWTFIGSDAIALGATVHVGLAVTSHDMAELNTSTFSNVALTQGAPQTPQPQGNALAGLVGRWRFPETSGATTGDSSGGNNTATLRNGARLGAGRGNAGNALHTDGVDDFASIPNAPSLNLSGAITMAGWVKFDTTQGLRTVVSHGYSASPVAETFLRIADGKYEVGSWNGAAHIASAPIASGDVGQWVHLTGTFDGSSWRLYRNGQLIATKATPVGALANPSVGWGIGAAGNARHFFKGAIDDLHVFDRALSAAEVKTLAV